MIAWNDRITINHIVRKVDIQTRVLEKIKRRFLEFFWLRNSRDVDSLQYKIILRKINTKQLRVRSQLSINDEYELA